MRDRDDRAGVVAEELLEPVDRFGVEMVRRFVEQQQVGARQQEAAQRNSTTLTTGQHGHVGVVGRATERVHGDLDVAVEAPCIGGGDLVLRAGLLLADLVVVGVGVGPLRHQLVVLIDDRLDLGHTLHDVPADVLRRIEVRLLLEVAHAEAGVSRASPEYPSSSPAMIFSSDDLPAPFDPSTPILAPG